MTIIPPCMRKCRQSVQSVNPPSLKCNPTSARCLSGICILGNWSPFGLGFGFGFGLALLPAWISLSPFLCLCLHLTLTPFLSLSLSFLLIAFFGY